MWMNEFFIWAKLYLYNFFDSLQNLEIQKYTQNLKKKLI